MEPKEFFLEWLPKQFADSMKHLETRVAGFEAPEGDDAAKAKLAKYQERLANAKTADVQAQIELTGGDGGVFTLHVTGGALNTREGAADSPTVHTKQSVDDFYEMLEGGVGLGFNLVEMAAAHEEERIKHSTEFARIFAPILLTQVQGAGATISFSISDRPDDDEDWNVTVGLGGAPSDKPTCAINVKQADYEALAQGKMQPQQAFFAGKLKITGDLSILMRFGALAMQG
jgi:putative sterol carrier protein